MRLLNEIRRYQKHFYIKFKYGVIGFYVVVLIQVTYILINIGFWEAILVYLIVEGIYGSIMIIIYLIEKYLIKTYK